MSQQLTFDLAGEKEPPLRPDAIFLSSKPSLAARVAELENNYDTIKAHRDGLLESFKAQKFYIASLEIQLRQCQSELNKLKESNVIEKRL